ncbi:response regulator transcription factor [Pseudanabaena sp. FACHB-2040]|uniref:response regulator transcription factor n=1 Tax=Pseudanabaena sp. FACHB-2040 TaxID=2692859 RepID=UPI00168818B4|nr:response regulator transcription factor [Pseudanabaena sp. FACHB-2040]MBD2259056.1 response regulator transcription factor [Pseudanabaena sp. FACHB-2040]
MIRLLLAEDKTIIRQGLRRLLESYADLKVVGEAENGQQAVEQAAILQPDLVLMDVRMPVMDGMAATQLICDRFPQVKVLILTTFDDEQYIEKVMDVGASGYLLKDTPSEELADAIRSAHRGYTQLGPGLFKKVFSQRSVASKNSADSRRLELANLTPREREVLSLIATGASNREIAEILCIAEKTVKNHVSSILSRLNLRDRTQAAVFTHSLPHTKLSENLKADE